MAVEVTDEAVQVLRNSLELAGVDTVTGGARLHAAHGLGGGVNVQVELADGPGEGEAVIEAGGIRIFVDRTVTEAFPEAIVAVEPQHERVVVRPASL
jgi:Fe-S cluster assembly iron-binding protein IscA